MVCRREWSVVLVEELRWLPSRVQSPQVVERLRVLLRSLFQDARFVWLEARRHLGVEGACSFAMKQRCSDLLHLARNGIFSSRFRHGVVRLYKITGEKTCINSTGQQLSRRSSRCLHRRALTMKRSGWSEKDLYESMEQVNAHDAALAMGNVDRIGSPDRDSNVRGLQRGISSMAQLSLLPRSYAMSSKAVHITLCGG